MATKKKEKTTITCDISGEIKETRVTANGHAMLPRGWRRFNDRVWSDGAWKEHFVCRAVEVPIVGPLDEQWPNLGKALRASWAAATELSNWMTGELFKHDVTRRPDMEKLPPMEAVQLYQEARERFPDMPTGSLSGVMQAVDRKYRKKRYEVVWLCKASVPNHRYPVPFPCRAQDWRLEQTEEHGMLVHCRLDGQRWHLILRRGRGQRRAFKRLEMVIDGEAATTELSLYRKPANSGDNRNGIVERKAGGGARVHYRVWAKIVAWFPKGKTKEREGTLEVCSARDKLLTATHGARVWSYNADHVRRWIVAHARRLDRISEDRKAERRLPRRRALQLQDHVDKMVHKFHCRMNTFLHQISSHLAGFAGRCGVARVMWNDADTSYVRTFPWHQLRTMMEMKLDALGIAFVRKEVETTDDE